MWKRKSSEADDSLHLLIADLWSTIDPTVYFSLLVKYQIGYLKYLLEKDEVIEEKELLLEDDIECVNCVLEYYNWLIKDESLRMNSNNNNLKPSQIYNILYNEFYQISQFCYLLWECISNTSNIFQPSQLTLRYLFHFFYLDTLLIPSNSQNNVKYIVDTIKTENEFKIVKELIPTKRPLVTLPIRLNDLYVKIGNEVYIYLYLYLFAI